eukprot:TRINITY_DN69260_c0_g1_i1.p1 TRINITY_DN69260_c0_g1~~TRINITY_DN69260_c0_g1_i1.p1  ORF type:complete len:583 (+),score=75.55 TRINITY_DN69260_c0_g1_i1:41-1789(+)
MAVRSVRRFALPACFGTLGIAWLADEYKYHRVLQRSFLTCKTGVFMLWQYKIQWTPENASDVHTKVAKRVVACLRSNEGLYVKFGQAMASMDVILPEEWKQELKVLHDQAATFPFSEVRQIVEEETGKSLAETFYEFDPEPIASASIAQVHRAKLLPSASNESSPASSQDACANMGQWVAVKVQKPNIPAQNACDLAMYKMVLAVLEYAFDLPLAWTFDYTRQQLDAELDFRVEAANAKRASAELAEAPHLREMVVVPRVYEHASSRRVLVMEWIDSLCPASDGTVLRKFGIDPAAVMRIATQVFGHQIFCTGHVHCDPHPGNLLVRAAPSGHSTEWQLVLLDHGLYCDMPSKLRQQYADFWVAAALGDHSKTLGICQCWGISDADAAEMFASLTQFRRVRLSASRIGAVAGLFGERRASAKQPQLNPLHHEKRKKYTPAEIAAAQARLKERAKKVLADTRSFPQELLFVGRNLNMIRSANFSLGSVVNRVAILAECAAAGSALRGGHLDTMGRRARQIAMLRFRLQVQGLLLVDRFISLWSSMSEHVSHLREFVMHASFGLAPLVVGMGARFSIDPLSRSE